ncbi:MAG TPA: hypothetical protein VD706_03240 [Candidatus Saccharimonadales bacterium]|nr:hypothetical protein [Candidatus Saccharimonadales bacterium]
MRRYVPIVILYVVLLVIGMGLGAFVHHRRSLVSFKVDIPEGATVKIYADQGGDAPFQYDPSKPLFTLSSDKTIQTKVGTYDFVIENAGDYEQNVTKTIVNSATDEVSINPDLSKAKLDSLLTAESGKIGAALTTKFSDIDRYYTVSKTGLYKHGQWAGVALTPKSNNYDPVRLVLEKSDSGWKVVTDPYIFVLGSLYKEVPPDVVASTNSL